MRKVLLTAIALALLVPVSGGAGTAADPEIHDARGDAQWLGSNATYADLTSGWFHGVHDASGVLTGFEAHIVTAAAPPADQSALLEMDWTLHHGATDCHADLTAYPKAHEFGAAPVTMSSDASAFLNSWCDGDNGDTISIGPLTVFTKPKQTSFRADGLDTIISVPFDAFEGTSVAGLYHDGTVLSQPVASTLVSAADAGILFVGVDYAGGRDYTIGS